MRPAISLIGASSGSAAIGRGDGFVGDGGAARGHQVLGLRAIGRQMQIGEQRLPVLEPTAFLRLRLLHLHDQFGAREQRLDIGFDARAGGDVARIGETRALTGAGFDGHLVSGGGELAHAGRSEGNPIFAVLDLAWHGDTHDDAPLRKHQEFRYAACLIASRAKKSPVRDGAKI